MKNVHKKDQILSSFLDFLYIQKGLSNNTAYSYRNDLLDYYQWCFDTYKTHPKTSKLINANDYVSYLFNNGLSGSLFISFHSLELIPYKNKFGSNDGDECIAIISPV